MKEKMPALATASARPAVALRQLLVERKSDMSDGVGNITELENGSPDFAKFIVAVGGVMANVCHDGVEAWLKANDLEKHYELYAAAVACLQLFRECNYTGREIEEGTAKEAVDSISTADEAIREGLLSMGGEDIEEVAVAKELLCFALSVFKSSEFNICSKSWPFQWWKMRCLMTLQEVLTEKSDEIYAAIETAIAAVESHPEWANVKEFEFEFGVEAEFGALFHVEAALIYSSFYFVEKAEGHVAKAAAAAGMKLSETGAMGRRTKFQAFDLAQLTLEVEVSGKNNVDEDHASGATDLPADLKLDDEVRMDKIKFAEESRNDATAALRPFEQAVLLAAFTLKQRAQPKDDLTNEELLPYLTTILSTKRQCWTLKTSALLLRSKLEGKDSRAVERSLMQVQTLVDSLTANPLRSPDRAAYLSCSRVPPFWQLETELCRLYQSLGSHKAALDIALRLKQWEVVIECYHLLQLRHKAAEVIRQQLETRETPLLYCMLGDATDELEHYNKALAMTEGRSARAHRALGMHYYFRKEYGQAVEHLSRSLELNSFQLPVMLRLGYAAMQVEDWEAAAKAYRKYCVYESDNFEVWNNLSNAYIKMGQKARAWKVLQEAVKCDYDNWKVWDNILVVSTDLAHFSDVIKAYHRILDLKERHVDAEVLRILATAIADDLPDNADQPSSRYLSDALKLMGRLTSAVTTESALWSVYADLTALPAANAGPFKPRQLRQRAAASAAQRTGWEKDATAAAEVIATGLRFAADATEYAALGDNDAQAIQLMSSAKMSLKGIVAKVKQSQTSVSSGEVVEQLRNPVDESVKAIQNLEEIIARLKST